MPMLMPLSWKKLTSVLYSQLLIIASFSLSDYSSLACTFTVTNRCPYTIWPGTLAGSGTPQLATTGFRLDSGQTIQIPTVPGWSGRIWARTGCTFDASGVGSCQTGDCGGKLECDGMGATPPASLFEITMGAGDGLDFYDVSLVDGYNIPLVALPQGVAGKCNATGCVSNINMGCPKELQVVGNDETDSVGGGPGGYNNNNNVVACKSACEAFGSDEYCCSGEYANPSTCRPSFYSGMFKRACPRAYSYAFDDSTSTFTCKADDYAIIFCPLANGMSKTSGPLTASPIVEESPSPHETGPAKLVSSSSSTYIFQWSIFCMILPPLIILIITTLYP